MPFLQGYIWQRDRFALQPSTRRRAPWQQTRSSRRAAAGAAAAAPPPHLWGSLSFGDNIEDEWFAVWLLLELTRAFPVTARCGGGAHAGCAAAVLRPCLPALRCLTCNRMLAPGRPLCRVWDNDGEFLLIEAAYGLPRWLKPETAQNRVWLHRGAVHLVPLPRHAGDPLLAATPSLAQPALRVLAASAAARPPSPAAHRPQGGAPLSRGGRV